jgi:hypothetical protein
MNRLVVVSNRLADPRKTAAGALAVTLGEALAVSGGLWFGSSEDVVEGGAVGEGKLNIQRAGNVTLASVDLCREDYDTCYRGYANSALWPVFHYRLDLADFDDSCIEWLSAREPHVRAQVAAAAPARRRDLGPRLPPDPAGRRVARRSGVRTEAAG